MAQGKVRSILDFEGLGSSLMINVWSWKHAEVYQKNSPPE
jgi:hypothetical protein